MYTHQTSECFFTKVLIHVKLNQWRQMCNTLQIIEPLTEKTWGRDCVIFGEQKNKERMAKLFRIGKYFEWIIKQLLNSAFERYSSYPTQPHSIIANYSEEWGKISTKCNKPGLHSVAAVICNLHALYLSWLLVAALPWVWCCIPESDQLINPAGTYHR